MKYFRKISKIQTVSIICFTGNIKTLNARRIFISKSSEIYITKNEKKKDDFAWKVTNVRSILCCTLHLKLIAANRYFQYGELIYEGLIKLRTVLINRNMSMPLRDIV